MLLPALRGALTGKDLSAAGPVEAKVITVGSWSPSTSGRSWGTEGRADGWDMATVIQEGFERVIWVFRCVQKQAWDQASLPFQFGRDIGGDDEEVLEDHPLYRVLNRRANPLETGKQFRKRLSAQVLLSKRGAFVEVTRSRLGTITRLDLLAPDRCRPVPDPRGDYLSHFEFVRSDGEVREIDPEKIRWIRDPHPTDPFSGVTPLEAAGISVELDFLMRLYNVTFIKNDARAGGIVAIDADGMSDQQLAKVQSRLQPGPQNAGHTALVGTGPGGLNYVDLSAKPRDMNYADATRNAKEEILAAFGIGESLLGNSSDRTFDNAEQEQFNYWSETQRTHLDLIASAFADDIDDDWEPYFDTSSISALDLPRRQRRDEARQEVDKGLRSIDEYRPLAGLDPVDNAQTRALWVSPAKAPIPTRPEDAAALGADQGAGGDQMPGGTGQPGGEVPAGTAQDAVAAAQALDAGGQPGAGGTAEAAVQAAQALSQVGGTPGSAADAVQAAQGMQGGGIPGAAARAVAAAQAMQGKTLETKTVGLADTPPVEAAPVDYDPGDGDEQRAELAVSAALDALLARQLGVITARLQSPKARKGTRFWDSAPGDTRAGDAPIDTARVVDEDRWAQDTADTLSPVAGGAGGAAALALLGAFSTANPEALTAAAGFRAAGPALAAVTFGVQAMRSWLDRVKRRLDVEALTASSIDDVIGAVRDEYAQHAHGFARDVAVDVAHTAVVGARDAAAEALTPTPGQAEDTTAITRTWLTRADALVRPTHAAAAGETRRVGDPFVVGGATLRYPGDPFAPIDTTAGCRCRLAYRAAPGARFIVRGAST
jgi:HK97 family phage portal protein